jgi:menaquinone-dependent protoporphyrinogen oxidase
VFSSGPVGPPKGEVDPAWVEPRRVIERIEELGARQHVVFGGRMPPGGRTSRAMAKGIPPEHQDRRDWDEIRAWATGIAAELEAGGDRPSMVQA